MSIFYVFHFIINLFFDYFIIFYICNPVSKIGSIINVGVRKIEPTKKYKKVEHTGGDREVLVDNIELSDETQLRESERANETC